MVDIYVRRNGNGRIGIFVHGGAWRAGHAKDSAYGAETFVRAGAHFLVLDFINVIESGGDLMPMIDQVRGGVASAARNAASFRGDPDRRYITRHSSRAHLARCAFITD